MSSDTNTTATGEGKEKQTSPKKKASAKTGKRSSVKKKTSKKSTGKRATGKTTARKKRTQRPYPAVAFKQATTIGDAIHKYAAGEKIRRLTLLEKLNLSPTSSSTMMLITNSGKYKITKGSYSADWLELTPLGQVACDPNAIARAKLDARFRLAIAEIAPFKLLYDESVGKKLVAREVMYDWLDASDLTIADKAECVDIFITNAKDLGILRAIAGSETLIPIDQALDDAGTAPSKSADIATETVLSGASTDWSTICFYVTPIGDDNSDTRKHSDLFKSSIVEPAMKELGLVVVRADEVGTPGMIATSILEHIKRSKLVVADLSMLNPNVFYEIALRHACKLPIVQIRRKGEDLPFDVAQVNTITIDNSDLYNFVPQIETFKSELASLARTAIENPERISNPITVFYPAFWD